MKISVTLPEKRGVRRAASLRPRSRAHNPSSYILMAPGDSVVGSAFKFDKASVTGSSF